MHLEEVTVPISIIIPVYNVCEWIDECMESVVNQTFANFEVILVNDGSTDGSDLKCLEWAKRDQRVTMISKENEGPSQARNMGIVSAKGEYLVFLDADDWIDKSYLEKMYQRIIETDADIAECDVYRYNNETGEKTYRVCSGNMARDYTLEEHMKYGYTAIWKCMFRKKLFTEHGVFFPDCHSEARAVYALLLALSGRVENIHEALYYYRRFRSGSLSAKPRANHGDENAIGVQALDKLMQGFQRCGLYGQYEKLLQEIVKLKLSDLLAGVFYRREKREFQRLSNAYYSFVEEKFPDTPNYRYITFGGYNLNRILWHVNLLHNPYCRFNFSSIISLMNPICGQPMCGHKNRYREIMLEREFGNQFWNILDEVAPEYIFIDLIEERFDMAAYHGGYLTKSDAFDGIEPMLEDMEIIPRDGEKCEKLWRESCIRFIDRLYSQYPSIRIVLVKNYLSEKVGDINSQKSYENLEDIQNTNAILRGYYRFFEEHCDKVQAIEASTCSYYYTDKQYEYGAVPSHLNELVNDEIAKRIEKVIGL